MIDLTKKLIINSYTIPTNISHVTKELGDSQVDHWVKNRPAIQETDSRMGKIPWRRELQHTPVFLPGKFHEQRSLVGYSAWGCKESDMTEQLSTAQLLEMNFLSHWSSEIVLIWFSFLKHISTGHQILG